MLLVALATSTLAADPPCYGHTHEDRVDSEHFWVEWEPEVLTPEQAEDISEYAEESRDVFLSMGWPLTDAVTAYSVVSISGTGFGGFAQTLTCDDSQVPRYELYVGEYRDDAARNVTAHELGHGAQYAFMGNYLDSVTSWAWWMEGTATWLALQVDGDIDRYANDAADYLAEPHLALHHGVAAYISGEAGDHMYGTAWLARFIEHEHGADAILDIWEAGAPSTGEVIAFPQVVDAAGLDFASLWPKYLAVTTTVDSEDADAFSATPPRVASVVELPAAGVVEEEGAPQGYGFAVVHIDAEAGRGRKSLAITFDGDPGVDWHVVLVRADGQGVGAAVLDYVVIPVVAGHGDGWLSDFDGSDHGFLVASPAVVDEEPRGFSWHAQLDRPEDPMPGTVVLREREAKGCVTGSGGPSWLWTAVLWLGARRVRPARVRGPRSRTASSRD